MGYLYVFTNESLKKSVLLGYTDNWEKRLVEANIIFNLPTKFKASVVYEFKIAESTKSMSTYINSLLGDAIIYDNLCRISEEDAVNFAKSFAAIRGGTIVHSSVMQNEQPQSKPASVNVVDVDKGRPNSKLSSVSTASSNPKTSSTSSETITISYEDYLLGKQYKDESKYQIIGCEFLESRHRASSFDEVVSVVLDSLYEVNPTEFRQIAHQTTAKEYLKFYRVSAFNEEGLPREISNSRIYYPSHLSCSEFNKLFYRLSSRLSAGVKRTDIKIILRPIKSSAIKSSSISENYKKTKPAVEENKENAQVSTESSKSSAIRLLIADSKIHHYSFNQDCVNYASWSANSGRDYYWVTAPTSVVVKNWSIILDDRTNKYLYLFNVPAYSTKVSDFALDHREINDRLDINISNDPRFIDLKGGEKHISFNQHLVATLKYSDTDMPQFSGVETLSQQQSSISSSGFGTYSSASSAGRVTPSTSVSKTDISKKNSDSTEHYYNLSDNVDLTNMMPTRIKYLGLEYEVENFADVVDYAADLFPKTSDERIDAFIAEDKRTYRHPAFISKHKLFIDSPRKLTGYEYYITDDISAGDAISFLKWLVKDVGVNPNSFEIIAARKY